MENNLDEKIVWEKPEELVVGENSRFRVDNNVSELMESIKQNGIIQPITARAEDKKIICGNRRLIASIKLGLNKVPVRYLKNINDKQLLILNLLENLQRKDITSIEVGRQADIMLKNSSFKMSLSELASSLGLNVNRIKQCIDIFKRLPPEFRKDVVHIDGAKSRKYGELPENVVSLILNFGYIFKPIKKNEMILLLKKAQKEKLSISAINLIGWLYLAGMPFNKAIKEEKNYTIMRVNLFALKTELADVMKKEKIHRKRELINKIVRDKYPNLVY